MDHLADILPYFYKPTMVGAYSKQDENILAIAFESGGFPWVDKSDKDPLRSQKDKASVWRCSLCGRIEYSEEHHIFGHASGGITKPWNVLRLCDTCHKLAQLGLWSSSYLHDYAGEWNLGITRKKLQVDPEEYICFLKGILREDVMNWPDALQSILALYYSLGHVAWGPHTEERVICAMRILRRLGSYLTNYGYDVGRYDMPKGGGVASFKRILGVHLLNQALGLIDYAAVLNNENAKRLEIDKFRSVYTLALHYRAGCAPHVAFNTFKNAIPNLLQIRHHSNVPLALIAYNQAACINDAISLGIVDGITGLSMSYDCLGRLESEDDDSDEDEHAFNLKHVLIAYVYSHMLIHDYDGALDALQEARAKIPASDKYFSVVYLHLYGVVLMRKGHNSEVEPYLQKALTLARQYRLNDREQKILQTIEESKRLQ